jgi:hypothetical protein
VDPLPQGLHGRGHRGVLREESSDRRPLVDRSRERRTLRDRRSPAHRGDADRRCARAVHGDARGDDRRGSRDLGPRVRRARDLARLENWRDHRPAARLGSSGPDDHHHRARGAGDPRAFYGARTFYDTRTNDRAGHAHCTADVAAHARCRSERTRGLLVERRNILDPRGDSASFEPRAERGADIVTDDEWDGTEAAPDHRPGFFGGR